MPRLPAGGGPQGVNDIVDVQRMGYHAGREFSQSTGISGQTLAGMARTMYDKLFANWWNHNYQEVSPTISLAEAKRAWVQAFKGKTYGNRNPGGRVGLKGFTGTVTRNPDGSVTIRGRGKRT